MEYDNTAAFNDWIDPMSRTIADWPRLLAEWDTTKNNELTPDIVSYGSKKEIWWRCADGHSWKATANNRTRKRGTNCPQCPSASGTGPRRPSKTYNLAMTNPEVLLEWDYDKNLIIPEEITLGAKKKIWWKCQITKKYVSFISGDY